MRPHIVLFIADDFTWTDCGAYGATDVRTPHLAALAAESIRFDNAFVASPTCAPSRSVTFTGLYPFRNGAHANHSLIRDGVRTLPQYMKALGYRVVLAGKTHIGPRESFPFEYLAGSNAMPPGKNHVLFTDLNTQAVDALLASHDRNVPLFLVVCSHSPHVYWPENHRYDPSQIRLPPYLLDTPETREARCRYYEDVENLDDQVGEVLASLSRHGYAQNTLFAFTIDHGAQWPFAKWTLYDAGIHAPLIVRWPGVVNAGNTSAMVSLVDLLPTFVEAGGGDVPENIDGRSLLPLLRGTNNVHHDVIFTSHTGDGKMNRSPMRCVRTARYKYILNLAPGIPFTTHVTNGVAEDGRDYWESWLKLAERDDHAARLVDRHMHRPPEELFDMQTDPHELKNLAGDPSHTHALSKLRQTLRDWRLQQGENLDVIPMPEDARLGKLLYAE
jgi:N-sulfoglucosamine sulfohydrolase